VAIRALLLLAVSLGWASEYLFIRWADRALPPLTVTAAMAGIGALMLFAWLGPIARRPLLALLRQHWLLCLVLAVTTVDLPTLAVVYAEDSISPDVAALTGAAMPIMTLLAAAFVTRQQPLSLLSLAGIGVAMAGLVVFVGLRGQGAATWDALAVRMAGLVAFLVGTLYASLRAEGLDKAVLTAWVLALAAILLAVPAALVEQPTLDGLLGRGFGAIAAAGVLSMALAYLWYFALIERAGPTFAALYAYLVPPLAVLLGVLLLGERLTWSHIAGLCLVLAGLWIVARGERRPAPGRTGQPAA